VDIYTKELFVHDDEISIASVLNECDEKFKDRVTLGSYPDFINSYFKVRLTLESQNKADLEEAYTFLQLYLPAGDALVHVPVRYIIHSTHLSILLYAGLKNGTYYGNTCGGQAGGFNRRAASTGFSLSKSKCFHSIFIKLGEYVGRHNISTKFYNQPNSRRHS